MAIINGRQYEFADIQVLAGGMPMLGFRGVNYPRKIEREAVYGKGRRARSIQSGNISVEGDLSMLQSDYEALIAASPGHDIFALSLDIIVCYGGNIESPAEAAGLLTTDKVMGVRFTEMPKGMSQGDKFMEVTIPFVALDVRYNIT